jgi:dolichol kinase
MPGASYFLLGVLIVEALCPDEIACLAVLILSFGDPIASLAGLYFKSPGIYKGKTVAGTGACALISVLLSAIFYFFVPSMVHLHTIIQPFEFCTLTAVVSILAELSPSSRRYYLDDNLSIPCYAGGYYMLYFYYMKL